MRFFRCKTSRRVVAHNANMRCCRCRTSRCAVTHNANMRCSLYNMFQSQSPPPWRAAADMLHRQQRMLVLCVNTQRDVLHRQQRMFALCVNTQRDVLHRQQCMFVLYANTRSDVLHWKKRMFALCTNTQPDVVVFHRQKRMCNSLRAAVCQNTMNVTFYNVTVLATTQKWVFSTRRKKKNQRHYRDSAKPSLFHLRFDARKNNVVMRIL